MSDVKQTLGMTDHALRLAIAKARPDLLYKSDFESEFRWQSDHSMVTPREWLAVMAECEKGLPDNLYAGYAENIDGESATWQNRAEWFLKTIGQWKETV